MKTLLLLFFFGGMGWCLTGAAQTNASKTAQNTNAVTALPRDVMEADAKVMMLYRKSSELSHHILKLSQKQSERRTFNLGPDPGVAVQISQLTTQKRSVDDQLFKAKQWDYQIRDSHKLPLFDPAVYRNKK